MNNFFQENQRGAVLLLILLFLLLFVAYYFLIHPLREELKRDESELETTEATIAGLNEQISNAAEVTEDADVVRYRFSEEIPFTPELEAMILTFEEFAYISNSRIEQIEFAYDDALPEAPPEEEEDETDESADIEEMEVDLEEEGEEEPLLEDAPDDLHVVIATMDVSSPDYDHFQMLLKEIEAEERIMGVTSMEFLKPGESEFIFEEAPDESIFATIEIAAFHYGE